MPLIEPTGMPVIVPDWLIVSAPAIPEASSVSLPPTPVSAPASEPAAVKVKVSLPAPPLTAVTPPKVPPPTIVPLPGPFTVMLLPLAAARTVVLVPLPVRVSGPPETCSVRLPVKAAPFRTLVPLSPVRVAEPMPASVIGVERERVSKAFARVRSSDAPAVTSSELLPPPPSIDATEKPAPSTNASAALPPTRLVTPVKFVVPPPSFTLPALVPVTAGVEATLRPVRVELVLLPTSEPTLENPAAPSGVAVPVVAELVSVKFAVARAERSSVFAAPVPPSTPPTSAPVPVKTKLSAPVPPASEAMPVKVVVPLTLPVLGAVTLNVEPALVPVSVDVVPLPVREAIPL